MTRDPNSRIVSHVGAQHTLPQLARTHKSTESSFAADRPHVNRGKNIPVCSRCSANPSPNSCAKNDSSRRALR